VNPGVATVYRWELTKLRYQKRTYLGLGAAILPVILGVALSKTANPLFKFVGISMLVIPGMLGLAGSAGLTFRIGTGLPSPADEAQPWRRVLRGGIVLAFSFLLPFVGWIIIPLWVLVSGFGAFMLALRELRAGSISSGPSGMARVNEATA
jgi:hypothetical protein